MVDLVVQNHSRHRFLGIVPSIVGEAVSEFVSRWRKSPQLLLNESLGISIDIALVARHICRAGGNCRPQITHKNNKRLVMGR